VTIEIHGDRITDRQGRALAVGRGRSGSMRRPSEPVEIARAAKALLRSRRWRNPTEVEGIFRMRLPEALGVFNVTALRALTKRPPSPGCHWCSLLTITVVAGDLEPPRDPAHLELLGQPCETCQRRHAIDAARRQARDEAQAAAVAAATLPPAQFCRTCGGSHPLAAGHPHRLSREPAGGDRGDLAGRGRATAGGEGPGRRGHPSKAPTPAADRHQPLPRTAVETAGVGGTCAGT
jgi:hypothetical protein